MKLFHCFFIKAREIMDEKPGAATKLAYQFFVAFNKKQPSAPVAADAKVSSRHVVRAPISNDC